MSSPLLSLSGLVAGLIFGLLVAWGMLSAMFIFAGIGVFLVGSIAPTMLRSFFGLALFGFIISWLISSGVEML